MSDSFLSREKISNFEIAELNSAAYLKLYSIRFMQSGVQRVWDSINTTEGVYVLLYHATNKSIVLCRQFRPSILVSKAVEAQPGKSVFELPMNDLDPETAIAFEMCGGKVKNGESIEEVAVKSAFKQCGYRIEMGSLKKISRFNSGAPGTLFYAHVDDTMHVAAHLPSNKFIEVYELPVDQVKNFLADESLERGAELLFALTWFLYERDEFLRQ